jgi:hypothetical protein
MHANNNDSLRPPLCCRKGARRCRSRDIGWRSSGFLPSMQIYISQLMAAPDNTTEEGGCMWLQGHCKFLQQRHLGEVLCARYAIAL